jgi:hypothetical protein
MKMALSIHTIWQIMFVTLNLHIKINNAKKHHDLQAKTQTHKGAICKARPMAWCV